jgi:hypothetical protein
VREQAGDKAQAIAAYQQTLRLSPGYRDTQQRINNLQ